MDHAEQVALAEDHREGFRPGSLTLDMEPTPRSVPVVQHGGALSEASPAGIMLAALAKGVSPADLREMLALQREWEAGEARKIANEALAAFKAEFIEIIKRKRVEFTTRDGDITSYKHAELADVVEAVGPALARHGFSYRWDVQQTKGEITVTCILKHAKGHSESVTMSAPPDASGKKNSIQQIASTVSYLQRYTLKAITGVAEKGEDNDGHGSTDDGTPPTADSYPPERFAANLPKWSEAMLSGRMTAEQVIARAESQHPLTQQQKADIQAVLR